MREYVDNVALEKAIKEEKPESVIRTLWSDYKKGLKFKKFLNSLTDMYMEEFPEYDQSGNYLRYAEYVDIDEDGNKIFKPDCYYINENGEQILKEYCQELVDKGLIRPTLDFYKELKIKEYKDPEISTDAYLNFIRPILKQRLQKLADQKTREVKKWLAGKEVTPEQEDRYRSKADTIKKITDTIQSYAIENDITDLSEAAEKLYEEQPEVFEDLEFEAERKGITPLELYNAISQDANAWTEMVRKKNVIIDGFRVAGNDLIDKLTYDALNLVDPLFRESYAMKPENITVDNIKALLARYGL